MSKAQGRGSGWVLLAWLARDNKLINTWAADHTCNLAGAYVDAFMQNFNWNSAAAKLAVCK